MLLPAIFPESEFLHNFFFALDKAKVRYVVLRNASGLPDTVGGSDLDLLVDPRDANNAKDVLSIIMDTTGGAPIGRISTSGFLKVFIVGKSTSDDQWWGLYVDITFGVRFNFACELVDLGYLHEVVVVRNGVKILKEDISGVLGVVKEVLYNDKVPSRYLAAAKAGIHNNPKHINCFFKPMGTKAIDLINIIVSGGVSDNSASSLRRALYIHRFLQTPLLFMWQRSLNEFFKIYRLIKPSGTVVAVLGVDGAGKSTVIESIRPVLEEATHGALFIQHLRPGLLPPLARLKGKKRGGAGPVENPHGSKPSNLLGSLFRLVYLTLDYILGYWVLIRPKIAKQPAVVLYDRYAYDMSLDPRRFRIGLPGWAAGLFSRLAPKPDLILCLHAGPEVIAARKQELSLEEICRQVEELQVFARKEPRAVLISTEDGVEGVRERVLQTLCEFFVRREKNGCKHG